MYTVFDNNADIILHEHTDRQMFCINIFWGSLTPKTYKSVKNQSRIKLKVEF